MFGMKFGQESVKPVVYMFGIILKSLKQATIKQNKYVIPMAGHAQLKMIGTRASH